MPDKVSLPDITDLKIIMLIGMSGGGKSHAYKFLVNQFPSATQKVIRGSTRRRRPEEVGVADLDILPGLTAGQLKNGYNIIVEENGSQYGLQTEDIARANSEGKIAVVVCMRDHAIALKELYGDAAFGILLAPTRKKQDEVLAERSGDENAKERMATKTSYDGFLQNTENKNLIDEVCINDYTPQFTDDLAKRVLLKIAERARKRGAYLPAEVKGDFSPDVSNPARNFSLLSTELLMDIVSQSSEAELCKSAIYAFDPEDSKAREFVFKATMHGSGEVGRAAYVKLASFHNEHLSLEEKLRIMSDAKSSTVRQMVAGSLNTKDEKLMEAERQDVREALLDRAMFDGGKEKVAMTALENLCRAEVLLQKDYKRMVEHAKCPLVRKRSLDYLTEKSTEMFWVLYNRATRDTNEGVAGRALEILMKDHTVKQSDYRDIILYAETSAPKCLAIEQLKVDIADNVDLIRKISARDGENPVVVREAKRKLDVVDGAVRTMLHRKRTHGGDGRGPGK